MNFKILTILLFSIISCFIFAQKSPFTIEDLYRVKGLSTASVSNDGQNLLFSLTSYNLPKNKTFIDIYISDIYSSVIYISVNFNRILHLYYSAYL